MITEVADPINNVSARFVELFNAGDSEINLSGWKLNKYVNGSVNVSSGAIDLNGVIIPGGFVIIANSDYKTEFNDVPKIESTYISGNGDDVYELVDNSGATIDIYGVIGEDGNGIPFNGYTKVFDAFGKELFSAKENMEEVLQIEINLDDLKLKRRQMNFLQDRDNFTLQ